MPTNEQITSDAGFTVSLRPPWIIRQRYPWERAGHEVLASLRQGVGTHLEVNELVLLALATFDVPHHLTGVG